MTKPARIPIAEETASKVSDVLALAGLTYHNSNLGASIAVHDCQLVDCSGPPMPYEVGMDRPITTARRVDLGRTYARPSPPSIETPPRLITQDVPLLHGLPNNESLREVRPGSSGKAHDCTNQENCEIDWRIQ